MLAMFHYSQLGNNLLYVIENFTGFVYFFSPHSHFQYSLWIILLHIFPPTALSSQLKMQTRSPLLILEVRASFALTDSFIAPIVHSISFPLTPPLIMMERQFRKKEGYEVKYRCLWSFLPGFEHMKS